MILCFLGVRDDELKSVGYKGVGDLGLLFKGEGEMLREEW